MKPFTAVLIIPTGIGAAIGGYAGDGMAVARAMGQICDRVITHPNVLNGAQLYWSQENIYYVEGYGLDRFTANQWGLQPVRQNKIGLLLDRAIEPELRLRHIQAADATRATLGLDIADYAITDTPLEIELRTAPSGASWGTIGNPGSLLRGAEKLIQQAGVQAIAIVARFPDDLDSQALQNYRHGLGVDHLAGAEAIISHLIVRHFQIPAAHAPALAPIALDPDLSPRAAAEELGHTFLPCVLVGLSRAPQFVTKYEANPHLIWGSEIDALIIPETACGGSSVLSLNNSHTAIITVKENTTQMQVLPETLGIKTIRVNSYLEALGVLVAHRAGISLASLHPSLSSLRCLS
jgi:hypothetical protein